ncbi:type II toxin-antitoxin system RatA family toxin [Hyphomicrobium sp.]|uniref:type II toxin-antitoxin system RatA family toxin n=1 Tax=Hyphomicrobium sp. TaxID=82 RepID=UPI002D79102C|nr:type II toxin-antitoxin system RatA family toxin [Hyphomicrobium sp.]HET6388159.1 type II toxin-antitoxin system RatA family toxin [Hyphomicrobium sp.]
MPSFVTQRHVRFSAEQMFALVADIEKYPEFLPLCTGLTVLSRQKTPVGEELTARMSIGYKAIAESFTTRVVIDNADRRIDVSYLDGPFKRLENRWKFEESPSGSMVDFFIDYEFRSKLLGALMGAMFDQAFRRFTHAFEERAAQIYGTPSAQPAGT